MPAPAPFRLYVGFDPLRSGKYCVGSEVCMRIVRDSGLESEVRVENLNTIVQQQTRDDLPGWLDGTPTLVDVTKKRVHHGSAARDRLLDLADMAATMKKSGGGKRGGETTTRTLESQHPQIDRSAAGIHGGGSRGGGAAAAPAAADARFSNEKMSFSSLAEEGEQPPPFEGGGDFDDDWDGEAVDDRKASSTSTDDIKNRVEALMKARQLKS